MIENVLANLDVRSLYSVSQSCQRLQAIARSVFSRQPFDNFLDLQGIPLNTSCAILIEFGRLATSLRLEAIIPRDVMVDSIDPLIITSLACDWNQLRCIRSIVFPLVDNLTVFVKDYFSLPLNCNSTFPNLRRIELRYVNTEIIQFFNQALDFAHFSRNASIQECLITVANERERRPILSTIPSHMSTWTSLRYVHIDCPFDLREAFNHEIWEMIPSIQALRFNWTSRIDYRFAPFYIAQFGRILEHLIEFNRLQIDFPQQLQVLSQRLRNCIGDALAAIQVQHAVYTDL